MNNNSLTFSFEQQVKLCPDAIAVVWAEQTITYGELNRKANQLAHYLQAHGIKPDMSVGILIERSLEMIIGLLAIMKAGGAYLPLDPTYPKERLAFMLEDAQIAVLLTQEKLLNDVPLTTVPTVCLDGDQTVIAQYSSENPVNTATPQHLAYIVYTSGSTGKPKGTMIQHESLSALVSWHISNFALTPHDRVAQTASIAFDAAGWEIWPCLCAGASLYLVATKMLTTPATLQNWLFANKITSLFITTPIAELLLHLPWPKEKTHLRHLLTGGDRLHHLSIDNLPFKLFNNYGPTEATVVASSGEVILTENHSPSIGHAIADTQIYILDEHLQPVRLGAEGEIYIGGVHVARGYINRHDLTAEKFIEDPFSQQPNAKLYRTGDLGRFLPDGSIEYLGRIDQQVNIHGHRIELEEIESVLNTHEHILESVVIAQPKGKHKHLVAYLLLQYATHDSEHLNNIDVNELHAYLKQRLPSYMIPSSFIFMQELPLTANGKIDRKILLLKA